ncbi:MAG: hypothetical protein ACI9G1_000600 [Pirellulaceae bacterium]|jgi:hypothetical protein
MTVRKLDTHIDSDVSITAETTTTHRSVLRPVVVEVKSQDEVRCELALATGIDKTDVLSVLLEANVDSSNLKVLEYVPSLQVGWADEELDSAERIAILEAAKNDGIGNRGYEALKKWIVTPPSAELIEAAETYLVSRVDALSDHHAYAYQVDILAKAWRIAAASGGHLGMFAISRVEEQVMEEVAATLTSGG